MDQKGTKMEPKRDQKSKSRVKEGQLPQAADQKWLRPRSGTYFDRLNDQKYRKTQECCSKTKVAFFEKRGVKSGPPIIDGRPGGHLGAKRGPKRGQNGGQKGPRDEKGAKGRPK